MDFYATRTNKLISCWQNILTVTVPILISKVEFKPSYHDLKFMDWKCSYVCTNLIHVMLKLKLQYFGHLMQRVDSLEKTLMLGGIEGRRRRGHRGWDGWMAPLTRWTWVWMNSGSWWWTMRPGVLRFMGSQRVGHDWATELNWRGKLPEAKLQGGNTTPPISRKLD